MLSSHIKIHQHFEFRTVFTSKCAWPVSPDFWARWLCASTTANYILLYLSIFIDYYGEWQQVDRSQHGGRVKVSGPIGNLYISMQSLWAQCCFVYSVTGETAIFTAPKVAPSGKKWICIFIQTNAKIKFSHVCTRNKWAVNMLMFYVDVNMKRLGIPFKND